MLPRCVSVFRFYRDRELFCDVEADETLPGIISNPRPACAGRPPFPGHRGVAGHDSRCSDRAGELHLYRYRPNALNQFFSVWQTARLTPTPYRNYNLDLDSADFSVGRLSHNDSGCSPPWTPLQSHGQTISSDWVVFLVDIMEFRCRNGRETAASIWSCTYLDLAAE